MRSALAYAMMAAMPPKPGHAPPRPEHLQLARATAERYGNVAAKVRAIDELGLPVTQREIALIVGVSRARVGQILEGSGFVVRQRARKRAWRRSVGMPEYSCTACGGRGHNSATCGEDEASAATAPTSDREDRTAASASGT